MVRASLSAGGGESGARSAIASRMMGPSAQRVIADFSMFLVDRRSLQPRRSGGPVRDVRLTAAHSGCDRRLLRQSGLRTAIHPVQHRPEREQSRSEEHTSELQSQSNLVCRLLLEKKKK